MSLSWPLRCHGPNTAAPGLRLYPEPCSSPEASTRGLAFSSGCVLFYLPWAWGTAAILRGRRQAPAASPQVARASGRCSTTSVWASTLSSLGFIVQACIAVILCTGPGDASWWIDLLNGGLYAQGIRLPAEDRPHCQGSLDRRSVDARLPLRPGGNIGVQAPDALKRGVDKNLLTGDDGCIFIDVRLGFLSTVRRCVYSSASSKPGRSTTLPSTLPVSNSPSASVARSSGSRLATRASIFPSASSERTVERSSRKSLGQRLT